MYIMTKVGQLKNVNLFLGKHNGPFYIPKILIFAVNIIIQIIVDPPLVQKSVHQHQNCVVKVLQIMFNLNLRVKFLSQNLHPSLSPNLRQNLSQSPLLSQSLQLSPSQSQPNLNHLKRIIPVPHLYQVVVIMTKFVWYGLMEL